MPALIYDETTSAFKEASNPKIYKESVSAFGDSGAKVYKDGVWVDAYSAVAKLEKNAVYVLGDTKYGGNSDGKVRAQCFSISSDGKTAQLQTDGMDARDRSWAMSGDVSWYYKNNGNFGNLKYAVSNVYCVNSIYRCSSMLINALLHGSALGASVMANKCDGWLSNGDLYYLRSNSSLGTNTGAAAEQMASYSLVIAPYFTLDLTKVKVVGDVIYLK